MNEQWVNDKKDLLDSIHQSRERFKDALYSLDEGQMTIFEDDQGWTIKDHIAHVAAWERSVVALLQGRNRFEGLGIDETLSLSHDYDQINAVIQAQNRDTPFNEVLDEFEAVHADLMGLLAPLTDEDLQKPTRHYLPTGARGASDTPVIRVIYSNTTGHYDEHLEWIETLVNQ